MNVWTDSYFDTVIARAGRVAVLMGGDTAEREISLRTGRAIERALSHSGVDAVSIDWSGKLDHALLEAQFDRYFIALHGRGGEDGQIQAALQLLGRPYTGSGVLGSALAMDKSRAKLAWQGAGLPTPPFRFVDKNTSPTELLADLRLPLAIKPAREGSSVGVVKATYADDISEAISTAGASDAIVIAEEWIDGEEYTLGILHDHPLPMIKLETPREFYDFDAKYETDDTRYICPCGLSEQKETEAANLALRAFKSLGAAGWGRIDLMADKQGRFWLIELNTVPGMTDHSLVPMAAAQAGLSFEQLSLAILATSMSPEELQ